jgi:radical SAM superfamily enzyme YgiQ (UPF0313 family)
LITRQELLDAERRRMTISPHGRLRVGVGYPNTYHVGQSSLAYQWVVELASRVPGVGVERFFADPSHLGRTLDSGTPLSAMDVIAVTCSFELDAVPLLQTLAAAGIPWGREDRDDRQPLVVLGGAVASINPLPLSPCVDVFCLGAAELLLSPLLEKIRDGAGRDQILEELADSDGFFVPRHHLGKTGRPTRTFRRLEKRDSEMNAPDLVPVSNVVTPHTEYSGRGLVEMSRGCPEKCRYCWVSYNYGRLRCYPTDAILDKIESLRGLTDRVGLVATAVGDHPDLAPILESCVGSGLNVAISSLRIPAMVPDVLRPLAASGARSVTIAPETGSEGLRRKLNKPLSNSGILDAAATAARCGLENLKMYFIVGLPEESDDDLHAIAGLVDEVGRVLRLEGSGRASVRAGVSLLVPKPYTPYHRQRMLDRREARRRLGIVESALGQTGGRRRFVRPSYREALWQGTLSRGGVDVFELVRRVAQGDPLGRVLTDNKDLVASATTDPGTETADWHFISTAPAQKSAVYDPPADAGGDGGRTKAPDTVTGTRI